MLSRYTAKQRDVLHCDKMQCNAMRCEVWCSEVCACKCGQVRARRTFLAASSPVDENSSRRAGNNRDMARLCSRRGPVSTRRDCQLSFTASASQGTCKPRGIDT